jgi:shikimate kinase / 3-dehydroquinate synthase
MTCTPRWTRTASESVGVDDERRSSDGAQPLRADRLGAPLSPALVFIGFMGAGKTTVAAELAAALGTEARDADRLLEERLGEPIEAFFDREGEPAFRAREEALAGELLETADGGVIALGGGALGSRRVREALRRHVAVLVDVDLETAWQRARDRGRPLARDPERFAALHAERAAAYLDAADAVLLAGRPAVARRATGTLRALAESAADPDAPRLRLLWATAESGDYPVWVGEGALGAAPWPLPAESRRFAVADETVARLHAGRLADLAGMIEVPPGEAHKTPATAERVWRGLAAQGVRRGDHVVAIGGGVVGDLAGFCAATYQRGVPVVHVPTTLVAQVDSAYGGKTGVDLPEAKNYVGAYHQPAGVVVDPSTLATLPAPELASGYAEVVKTALIAGGDLWERVAGGAPVDEHVILACALTKLRVVATDERDAGPRQVLNLGHTVGHALETVTGYARLRHGEAVGLGLLAALELSGQPDLRACVAELLEAAGLPSRVGGVDPDDVLAATGRDKKRAGDAPVGFVLVDAPGRVRFGVPVDPADVRAAIAALAG